MTTSRVISGTVYVVKDNIDTDQIITAEFMKFNPSTPEGYNELGRRAMCGLPDKYPTFVNKETGKAIHPIIIGGENFGCGSSREHAPIALGASGVKVVIAQSFARIFFRNCISTGEILPVELTERLCDTLKTGDKVEIYLDKQIVKVHRFSNEYRINPLGALVDIVDAGGLFKYARKIGKI